MNTDTDPSELAPVFDAIDEVRQAAEEHSRAIGVALNNLRSLVLEHYQRTTARLDEHARRIRRLEDAAGLAPPRAGDGL